MRTTSDGTVITQHAHEKYLAYKAKAEDYSRALKQGPGHGKKHKHKSKSETSSSTSTSKSSSTSSTDSTLTSSTSSRKTSKRKHHAKDDMLRLAHANEMRRREEQAQWEQEQAIREVLARFYEGWNAHDVDRMVSAYAGDIDHRSSRPHAAMH